MKITKILFFALVISYTLSSFAIPNPAAVNCKNKGLGYILIKNVGICIFPDGSYCEEWAFFKGNCHGGEHKFSDINSKNILQNQK